jgi:hypothetical protein
LSCRQTGAKQGKHHMNRLVLALALGAVAIANPISSASAATAPCEDTLKTLRAAEAAAKLSDADKTKVSELETKASSAATPTTTNAPTTFSLRP